MADLNAGGAVAQVVDGADRIGQGGDLLQPLGHGVNPIAVEQQPILQSHIQATGLGRFHVEGVGGKDLRQLAPDDGSRQGQRPVLAPGVRRTHEGGRRFGLPPQFLHDRCCILFHDPSTPLLQPLCRALRLRH